MKSSAALTLQLRSSEDESGAHGVKSSTASGGTFSAVVAET